MINRYCRKRTNAAKNALEPSVSTLLGAIAFYTCIPIPQQWKLEFNGIARWISVVGLLIGGVLGLLDWGLTWLGMPTLVRSTLVIAAWVGITGGLHLDGAMDSADGLAVPDPRRRLSVMADSRTGAFGVMAAGLILLLKTTALASLDSNRWLALLAVTSWARWGQLVAIARYPYLRPNGKGALHKAAINSTLEAVPSLWLLLGLSGLHLFLNPQQWVAAGTMAIGGGAIALFTGAWFNHKLGGHTGDTYGATVEWTESLFLCLLTVVWK